MRGRKGDQEVYCPFSVSSGDVLEGQNPFCFGSVLFTCLLASPLGVQMSSFLFGSYVLGRGPVCFIFVFPIVQIFRVYS